MLLCNVGKALCKRLYAALLLLLSEGDDTSEQRLEAACVRALLYLYSS